MSQQVIGPALKLARTVFGLTQQQAGEVIGISAAAAKNVFALYERGARAPSEQRLPQVVDFLRDATTRLEDSQPRRLRPSEAERHDQAEEPRMVAFSLDDIAIDNIVDIEREEQPEKGKRKRA